MQSYFDKSARDLIPFIKMHGIGNDFVIIDDRDDKYSEFDLNYRKIANRKVGIGCDQIILIKASCKATCKMIIYNADGSSAEMCGNAARCVADFISSQNKITALTIELLNEKIIYAERLKNDLIKINMGTPLIKWNEIPVSYSCDTLYLPIELGPLKNPVGICMGNPHAIFFVDNVSEIPLEKFASKLEVHSFFINRANISIAEITSNDEISVRVWERGVGITDSCGSAACATLVAAVRRGYIAGKCATIKLPGGDLFIELNENNEVYMTGEATIVFKGVMIDGKIHN